MKRVTIYIKNKEWLELKKRLKGEDREFNDWFNKSLKEYLEGSITIL